jgi:hypothetical protein
MAQPKRRGRPRLDPARPSEPVYLTLAGGDYDTATKLAARRRESIQDFIRRTLRHELTKKPS